MDVGVIVSAYRNSALGCVSRIVKVCASTLPRPATSRDVFLVLHASRGQTLRLLALPAALPALATALRVGATYSVLVALLAEYLMQTGGLGALFAVTMQQFHLARALGASVVAMTLSVLLFEVSRSLESRIFAFYRTGN